MDLATLQKIHAINSRSKKHQFLVNFFLYTMTLLSCSLICSPFWFPSFKLFLFASLPKISSFFLDSKFLFIVGNLIIIVLVGESKFFASSAPRASDAYYDEYINRQKSLQSCASSVEEKKERKGEKLFKEKVSKIDEDVRNIQGKGSRQEKLLVEKLETEDFYGEDEISLPTDELNKRADDFIARVNRQMRLEARLLICCSN